MKRIQENGTLAFLLLNGPTFPLCSPLLWSEDALISTLHNIKA